MVFSIKSKVLSACMILSFGLQVASCKTAGNSASANLTSTSGQKNQADVEVAREQLMKRFARELDGVMNAIGGNSENDAWILLGFSDENEMSKFEAVMRKPTPNELVFKREGGNWFFFSDIESQLNAVGHWIPLKLEVTGEVRTLPAQASTSASTGANQKDVTLARDQLMQRFPNELNNVMNGIGGNSADDAWIELGFYEESQKLKFEALMKKATPNEVIFSKEGNNWFYWYKPKNAGYAAYAIAIPLKISKVGYASPY